MNYHRDEDYKKFESTFRNIFQKRFNLLRGLLGGEFGLPRGGRVLDIGASTGAFLSIFKEEGWEVLGVDPSRSSAGEIKIIHEHFEKTDLPKNYFDLVILNHTLEHMDNPMFVLKKVYKVLKKNGILFVDVPNAGGLGAKILGRYWPYRLPKEHKHQFTGESLSKIFGKAGFKVIHFASRSGIFEYVNPLLELKRKRFLLDIFTIPYSLIATALQMGDSMSLIGRKYKRSLAKL